ncbi:MAG: hypothetical protein SPF96_10365 [Prevotella sp.]|nr:hypothetical protein [Prevotella sp.]
MPRLRARVDVERRRALVVEGAASLVAPAESAHAAFDNLYNIGTAQHLLNISFANHVTTSD